MTDALFDLDVPDEEPRTGTTTLRARQAERIRFGQHPLAYDGRVIALHPQAPRVVEDDGGRREPFRCGTCAYRAMRGGLAGRYPKCWFGATETPIPDRLRRPGGPTVRVSYPRATGGLASDARGWWPACVDYRPALPSTPDAAGAGPDPTPERTTTP